MVDQAELIYVMGGGGEGIPLTTPIGYFYVFSFMGFFISFATLMARATWGVFRTGPHSWSDFNYSNKFSERAAARNQRTLASLRDLRGYFATRLGKLHGICLGVFAILFVVSGVMNLVENKHTRQQNAVLNEQSV